MTILKRPLDAQYYCALWIAQYIDAGPYTVNIIVQYFGLCKILYRVKAILKIVQYIAQH